MKRYLKTALLISISIILVFTLFPSRVHAKLNDDDDDRPLSEQLEEYEKEHVEKALSEEELQNVPLFALGKELEKQEEEEEAQFTPEDRAFREFGLEKDPFGVVPDDIYDGEYKEFKNKDGSFTRVFDNGSVATVYKDGSFEAVDYKGNRHTEDSDGKTTIYTIEGNTIREISEGKVSITQPGGNSSVTIDSASGTVTNSSFGVCKEYDSETGMYSVYFEGNPNDKIVYDINDDPIGELHGENGEYFYCDGNTTTIRSQGMEFDSKTVYDGENDYEETRVKLPNGATRTDKEGYYKENGNRIYKIEGEMAFQDGSVRTITYTELEKSNGTQLTCFYSYDDADGSYFRKDFTNNAEEYYNAENGGYYLLDKYGNPLKMVNPGVGESEMEFDENGNFVKGYMTFTENNVKISREGDDKLTIESPDGLYVFEKDNIYKDGVALKENGVWLVDPEDYGFSTDTEEVFRPKRDDVLGSWDISFQFSNMSSQLVDMIIDIITKAVEEAFDTSLDGEVTSGLEDQVATIPGTMEITKGTGKNDVNVTLTMYGDDGEASTYKYTGKVKNGTMKLKLVGEEASVSDESINIGLNKLEFELYGRKDRRYMTGVYVLKSFVLNADINYSGERFSATE